MFTFPSKGDTLDFFSLCQVSSFSLRCPFVGFAFPLYPWQCVHRRALLCATPTGASPINLSLPRAKNITKPRMSANNNVIPPFPFPKNPKENKQTSKQKKDAKMLWMYDSKCHLQDCTFLTVLFTKGIQIALKKKKRDFAVLYIKWCLFSILTLQVTSEGATSTRFLYLHVKCQQQFIDIVLPFIIRVFW